MQYDDLIYYLSQYQSYFPLLIPLGMIGMWRWSVWGIKKIVGISYKPHKSSYKDSVSLVTPVYNENPDTFTRALASWAKNKPTEIIAVIDYTDKTCIRIFRDFAKSNKSARMIITKTPGKREALADGIKIAKSNIIALVDSDTLWHDDTLKNGIMPFSNPKIGGVATRQNLETPRTFAQKLFSMRLEQRYWDDFPFLAQTGGQIVCLSGRTAIYRREALLPIVHLMLNEKFMGDKVISGEDKRLTYSIEKNGWETTYQSNAIVSTIGEKNLKVFVNQQIRWTRNSWRNDLRAIGEGWVFRYPIFAAYLMDRAIQPFTALISPVYFVISIYFKLWIPAVVILVWWHVSRLIKMYPHLRKYPGDILLLPSYIAFNFVSSYIRIYSLLSINTQGWITRWHKSRLAKQKIFYFARAHLGTIFLFSLVAIGVYTHRYSTFIFPHAAKAQLVARALPSSGQPSTLAQANGAAVLGAQTTNPEELLTKKYLFEDGDSLSAIAAQYDVSYESLLQYNVNKITNVNRISPGLMITIPPKSYEVIPFIKFNYLRVYADPLVIYYNEVTDSVTISGRGNIINLTDIANSVGPDYLEEVEPGVWYLKSNLHLRTGITLKLNQDEVKWLKMKSDKNGFASILAYNSDVLIDKVKITSWDVKNNTFDTDQSDGRSFILVKDNSRMDINDSELAYLGYPRPLDSPYSTYGVSWKLSVGSLGIYILTGEVTNSKFHNNYFGLYTFGATGMTFRGNEFYNNTRYGLDPHDDSNGALVENNSFHDNGTHGLIFSKRCVNNTVRNNVSFNNKLHGIMLHEESNNNLIVDNKIYGNHDGVSIDNSKKNTIRNNSILANKRGIVADKVSTENSFDKNQISNSKQYGIYLYDKADKNEISNNEFSNNPTAIYVKTNNNHASGNILNKNEIGVYLLGKAQNNTLASNRITYSGSYGVYAKIVGNLQNFVDQNNYIWRNNDKNLSAEIIE
jgi:hyaluronan synthase